MREIKFRVFLDGTDYPDWHEDCGKKRMLGWEEILDGTDPLQNFFTGDVAGCSQPLQYTGLKDKNGKEIYEGDIAEIGDGYPQNTVRAVVKFEDGAFTNCHPGPSFGGCSEEIEIIGNVHENPELLQKEVE